MAMKTPNFRSSFMGFRKGDVADFLARTESEMEFYESRQAAADKSIAFMKGEIQNLTKRLEELTEENCQLETNNAQLRQTAFDYDNAQISADEHQKVLEENRALRAKLAELEQKAEENPEGETVRQLTLENEELRQTVSDLNGELQTAKASYQTLQEERDELKANVYASEKNLQCIQDALVSAQQTRSIILSEAKNEAERVTGEAQKCADQIWEEAQQRNAALQQSYDRMLLDTSKMKSELIELYRRHLALLAEIPGKGDVPVLEVDALEISDE